ncbi:hypothetical protein ABPG74_000917 [Tetrahymena malaccensis]
MSAALDLSEFSRDTEICYQNLFYLETKQSNEDNSLYFFKQIIHEPEYFFNEEYFKKETQQEDIQNQSQQVIKEQSNHQSGQQVGEFLIENKTQQEQNCYYYQETSQYQSGVLCQCISQSSDQAYFKDELNQSQSSLEDIKSQKSKTNLYFSSIETHQIQLKDLQQEEGFSPIPINNSSQKYKQQNQFKNIINAFKGYVKKLKKCEFIAVSHQQFINLKKQLFRYMKLNSFYYSVLKYIINHKFFKQMLINFFESESQIWITSSKLQDKNDAFNKIEQLKQCVQHPDLLQIYLGQQNTKIQKQKI